MADINLPDTRDTSRKDYMKIQNKALRDYQAKFADLAQTHLAPGSIDVTAFRRAINNLLLSEDIPGTTRTALTAYAEPLIRAAKEVEKSVGQVRSNALSDLYGLFSRVQADLVNTVTEDKVRKAIAEANVSGGRLNFNEKLESAASQLGVDKDSDRLVTDVVEEFRRRFI